MTEKSAIADRPPSIHQPIESRAECPICMLPLPLDDGQSIYESCCGKLVCRGCTVGAQRAAIDKSLFENMSAGINEKAKKELIEFQLLAAKDNVPCAFCRSNRSRNEKEEVERLQARVDKFNDPLAMNQLGDFLIDGLKGLKQNRKKAMELYGRSYELGSPEAADRLSYYNAGNFAVKLKYLKEGAKRGHINSCVELGVNIANSGTDVEYAKRLLMTAAGAGDDEAMGFLWRFFRSGHLSKGDLEGTLRAKQSASDEVKSENREFAKKYLAFLRSNGFRS